MKKLAVISSYGLLISLLLLGTEIGILEIGSPELIIISTIYLLLFCQKG